MLLGIWAYHGQWGRENGGQSANSGMRDRGWCLGAARRDSPLNIHQGDDQALGGEVGALVDRMDGVENGLLTRDLARAQTRGRGACVRSPSEALGGAARGVAGRRVYCQQAASAHDVGGVSTAAASRWVALPPCIIMH